MSLVGGNPYLLRLAMYNVSTSKIKLKELLVSNYQAISVVYGDHLQRQLWTLQQQNSDLLEAFKKVVFSSKPIELDLVQSMKLQSLGLVDFQDQQIVISCRLYKQYFQQHFQGVV